MWRSRRLPPPETWRLTESTLWRMRARAARRRVRLLRMRMDRRMRGEMRVTVVVDEPFWTCGWGFDLYGRSSVCCAVLTTTKQFPSRPAIIQANGLELRITRRQTQMYWLVIKSITCLSCPPEIVDGCYSYTASGRIPSAMPRPPVVMARGGAVGSLIASTSV